MTQNPATAFGVEGSYEVDSAAKDLREAWKLREEHNRKFGQGKDISEWGVFDYRSGKPK